METLKWYRPGYNGCCLLSELMRRHRNSSLNRFLLKTYFHCLLFAFVTFWFIILCLLLLLVFPDVAPVMFILDLHMNYTVDVDPPCILCGLLSCDCSPLCKKCCCVFAHHYTLNDDFEFPMDYQLSIFPKVFSLLMLIWFHKYLLESCQQVNSFIDSESN